MAHFQCRICGNEFDADAELAVCNGINIKADADGNPVTSRGRRLYPDELLEGKVVLEDVAGGASLAGNEPGTQVSVAEARTLAGHASHVMKRTKS